MPEFLVQRYIPNVANETAGGWVDEGTVTDLKATDAELACAQVAAAHGSYTQERRRAVRWDTAEEFDTVPGPPGVTKAAKASREAKLK